MIISIAGLLAGALLGTCFKVLVLVPITMFIVSITGGVAVVSGVSLSSTVWTMAIVAATIQLGYLGASVARIWTGFGSDTPSKRIAPENPTRTPSRSATRSRSQAA